jgi:HK97 family phage prohead protease
MQPDRITFSATAAITGNMLTGIAHTFGRRALVGDKYVEFAAGSFDQALAKSDVRAFWNHDTRLLLGRQSANTVRLFASQEGLHYEIDLPDTSYVQDMKVLIDRGDLTDMSFGVFPGQVTKSRAIDGKQILLHTSVSELFDISPVSLPAFQGTSVQLHGRATDGESPRSQAIKARARVNKEN